MFKHESIQLGNTAVYLIRYTSYDLAEFQSILSQDELQKMNGFLSEKRKYEFLSTRILKEHLFPNTHIQYSSNGAPFIENLSPISISHSKGCSAMAVADHKLGLDIEPLSDKAKRLHAKFLNEEELNLLDTSNEVLMTKAWSCKEALLKLCRRKGLIFKRDLIINGFDGNETFTCTIRKDNQLFSVSLTSIVKDDIVITVNTDELKQIDETN